jgi:hypothetical protein
MVRVLDRIVKLLCVEVALVSSTVGAVSFSQIQLVKALPNQRRVTAATNTSRALSGACIMSMRYAI